MSLKKYCFFFRTSEMDSSESQHGNGSTASSVTKSSTRVQRVTPTKRDMASSGSTSTSSSTSTPVVRNILQQLTTPRSARTSTRAASGNRTPTGTPNMTRNVRPVTNRTSSSNVSPAAQVTVSFTT